MKTSFKKLFIISTAVLFFGSHAFAFTPFKSKNTDVNNNRVASPSAPNATAPFDGGLSLLIAAGVGYAAKKRYDKRKNADTKAS